MTELKCKWIKKGLSLITEGQIKEGCYYLSCKYNNFDEIRGILAELLTPYEDEDTGEVSYRTSQVKFVDASDPDVETAFPLEDPELEAMTKISLVEIKDRWIRHIGYHSIPRQREREESNVLEQGWDEIDLGF